MIYEIVSVEDKNADWKVATVREAVEGGVMYENVSINRKNRDDTIAFSGFDNFAAGYSFEGSDIWANAKGQKYIFAPKPKAQPKKAWAGGGAAAITKAQETKAENIKEAQERKNEAIAMAGAMRDATLVSLASLRDQPFPTDEEYKAEWTKWVKWFLSQGEQPFL